MDSTIFLVEFAARVWPRYFASGTPHADGSSYLSPARVPIVGGVTYKITAQARRTSLANGALTVGVLFYDAAGVGISLIAPAASSATPGTSWATYSGTFGATGTAIPGGAVTMAPYFIANGASTDGQHHIKAVAIENNSAPGVALSHGADTRDLAAWSLFAGTAASVLTEIDAIPQTIAMRYATGAYITAAADTPARTPYEARVLNPGMVRSELPADWRGQISGSLGEVVLSNADGALADWTYFGLDGQEIAVLYGGAGAARSTFVRVMAATIQTAVVDRQSVRLRLAGPEARLTVPLLTVERSGGLLRGVRYLGTNALPAGIEGTPDDLQGRPRPRLYGRVKNIAPPCVNTARLIYEIHNPWLSNIYGGPAPEEILVFTVRERGADLTAGADYTDLADLEANAPSAGAYRVWPEGGLFRLGTAPAGLVTCDAEMWPVFFDGGRTGWQDLAATVIGEAAEGLARINYDHELYDPPDNWTGAGVTAGRGADVGVWVDDLRPVSDVLNAICGSAGAWYGYLEWANIFSGDMLRLGYEVFPPPLSLWEPDYFTGHDLSYVPAFDDSIILQAKALPDPGEGRGLPVGQVDLGYAPNANPMAVDIDAGVSQADRALLAAPMQRVTAGAGATLMNPRARTLVRNTALTEQASADDEALRLLHLNQYPKVWLEVQVALQAVLAQTVKPRLGGYVKVTVPNISVLVADGTTQPWGYYTVQALECDFKTQRVRMTLRQATEQTRV